MVLSEKDVSVQGPVLHVDVLSSPRCMSWVEGAFDWYLILGLDFHRTTSRRKLPLILSTKKSMRYLQYPIGCSVDRDIRHDETYFMQMNMSYELVVAPFFAHE